jgi:hypothetical protein
MACPPDLGWLSEKLPSPALVSDYHARGCKKVKIEGKELWQLTALGPILFLPYSCFFS